MIRRPPRSTQGVSSAASDVYKRQVHGRSKIMFVVWAPDTAKVKSKMLYASSKDNLRKKFVGIGVEVQATDLSEIDYKEVEDKVKRVQCPHNIAQRNSCC
eukprot:TRINITY_DN19522_c0_g1_i2.p2 TRINITY_DN19522_c0_g1~~TRINITY_DN19522_c0_g1_i2.p2  ORF type:complete len:100 (-),score=24.49 TRINITY_DN19522_c0_g1_i2:87-386(-)